MTLLINAQFISFINEFFHLILLLISLFKINHLKIFCFDANFIFILFFNHQFILLGELFTILKFTAHILNSFVQIHHFNFIYGYLNLYLIINTFYLIF